MRCTLILNQHSRRKSLPQMCRSALCQVLVGYGGDRHQLSGLGHVALLQTGDVVWQLKTQGTVSTAHSPSAKSQDTTTVAAHGAHRARHSCVHSEQLSHVASTFFPVISL